MPTPPAPPSASGAATFSVTLTKVDAANGLAAHAPSTMSAAVAGSAAVAHASSVNYAVAILSLAVAVSFEHVAFTDLTSLTAPASLWQSPSAAKPSGTF